MDTQEKMIPKTPPVRARRKHIAVFVIACVCLGMAAFFACLLLSATMNPPQVEDAAEDPLAMGALLFAGVSLTMASFIMLFLFAVNWLMGVILMSLLAMERHNKPKWLWVASLTVLTVFMILVAVSAVGMLVMA